MPFSKHTTALFLSYSVLLSIATSALESDSGQTNNLDNTTIEKFKNLTRLIAHSKNITKIAELRNITVGDLITEGCVQEVDWNEVGFLLRFLIFNLNEIFRNVKTIN